MAITNKEKGVWGLDQVYNKINQGSIWEYSTNIYGLWGWGRNNYGQVGYNNAFAPGISSPAQIPGTTWKTLGMDGNNQYQGFATKTDGSLWSWGAGVHGALGHNQGPSALTGLSSPVQIPGTWSDAIFSGTGVSYAVKTDGTLWTWGNGNDGATALNNLTKYSSPVQVGSDTTWDAPKTAGNRTTFATKTDGTLWSWGYAGYGRLGHNQGSSNARYSSPVQLGSDTDWSNSTISGAPGRIHFLKSDGTLYATGYGAQGGLGQNNRSYYSSPVQIPGTTWKSVGSTTQATMATKTDGTLWVWGMNEYGNLGQNQAEAQLGAISSPTQIPGTTWNTVSNPGADTSIFVTKTDGTAWAWGRNYFGQLGVNVDGSTTGAFSSPTQIAATDGWIGAMTGVGVYVGAGLRSL